jgi:hypothetical protein
MARRYPLAWNQPFPGWDPLPDPGPLPLRAAGSLRRWWWPTTATVGFLIVVGYVFGHDDPRSGLSDRGWLTIALAAVVVVLLTVHRASRGRPPRAPLARALGEYTVVALLAALLATTDAGHQPAEHGEDGAGRRPSTERPANRYRPAEQADATADRRPGIVRVVSGVWGWFVQLWRDADQQTDPRTSPTSTTTPTPKARALPAPAPPTWRSQP